MARSTLDIADAVAAEITTPAPGTEWTQAGFDCQSTLLPIWSLEELETLRLSVIGTGTDGERETRKYVKDTHRILVGAQKAVSGQADTQRTEIVAIIAFLFELKAYWLTEGRRLLSIPTVYCMKAKVHVLYNPEALESENVYEGLLELNFEEIATG